MNGAYWFFLVYLFVSLYNVGLAWQVQLVAYPLCAIVREEDFPHYHQSYARKAIGAIIIPAYIAMLLSLILLVVHPSSTPFWAVVIIAVIAIVELVQTLALEVPRHLKLNKFKDQNIIEQQLKTSWIRTVSFTVQGLLALWLVTQVFVPR